MTRVATPATIRWQSFVDPVAQGPYICALEEYLAEIAGDGIRYEVVGISPGAAAMHPLTEWRCATTLIENAFRARRDGCAAFITGHFPDPAIVDVRSSLGIPVLGLGEASLITAATLARLSGIVTIHPILIPITETVISRLGLGDRIVGVTAMQLELDEIVAAFEDHRSVEPILARLEAAAAPLATAGAELIVLGSGTQLMFVREHDLVTAGLPVLNGIVALTGLSESAVRLSARRSATPPPEGNQWRRRA